ncbi:zinc ribbon domain-containing protein [Candidatus Woesearchaeota archaeon]|nr:zinc ribbon domain-containing protein [Candidatus Woesearchaeota archaeon]MCF7901096.1 zinc ribbon domain-containing protein [Candidatus Woesearchaeota archaeon]MCF8013429.1 zinc ribbon domain-containing protein [Candidatus Woesearchaeota archaeon]
MKIHGFVWLIVGAFMTGFSAYVESIKESANLDIFFYVGIAFGAFGLFKLIILFINPKNKKEKSDVGFKKSSSWAQKTGVFLGNDLSKVKTDRDVFLEKQRLMQGIQRQNSSQSSNQNVAPQRPGCPKCGAQIMSGTNFCFNCGQRLR